MLRSIKTRDYMTTSLVKFTADTELYEAIEALLYHRISGAPVVDEYGKLIGIFSEGDCLKSVLSTTYHEGSGGGGLVGDYMSTQVDTVSPEHGIVEVVELFQQKKRRRMPVVENGRLVGQISRRDIVRAMKDFYAYVPETSA